MHSYGALGAHACCPATIETQDCTELTFLSPSQELWSRGGRGCHQTRSPGYQQAERYCRARILPRPYVRNDGDDQGAFRSLRFLGDGADVVRSRRARLCTAKDLVPLWCVLAGNELLWERTQLTTITAARSLLHPLPLLAPSWRAPNYLR